MGKKYDDYRSRFTRRRSEPSYREVNQHNLNRVGEAVLRCMDVAGEMPLPDKWGPMLQQIDDAFQESPQHLVVVLWRVLCNKIGILTEPAK